ncbi:Dihydroorotate dehydrogenase B (NAD(+)), electron transfer subunit [Candidatus Thermoflexus japonica]|uniref:Dihydroorotate dehydrogenase B (NAD(+)), electron transfer subunit n=1 Tax=Candidatus Thermoflexus japonica TaxID=2035417 RepID=A0A2H5Y630_9CHLR|nr:Dihydroorotate dehydrogenase B (NAD(+)), electron transfer subunit [Candidatus Thermoflexus japonica]
MVDELMTRQADHRWEAGGQPRAVRVIRVVPESTRVKTLILDARVEAQPGQFVMAWLPGYEEKPFSLAEADPVALTVARVGPFSSALHALQPGDRLWIRGPLGHGFTIEGQRILLVGGGYGVAPLAFLARQAIARGIQVTALTAARRAEDVLYVDRFRALGASVVIATEDGSAGERGRAPEVAARVLRSGSYDALYGCGPEGMLEGLRALATEFGIPAQLSYEAYMRCGIGLCGSCEREGVVLCLEGPVLRFG